MAMSPAMLLSSFSPYIPSSSSSTSSSSSSHPWELHHPVGSSCSCSVSPPNRRRFCSNDPSPSPSYPLQPRHRARSSSCSNSHRSLHHFCNIHPASSSICFGDPSLKLHACSGIPFGTILKKKPNRFCTTRAELHSEEGRGRPGENAATSVEFFQEFIQLNVGSWTGAFTQYDSQGNTLQHIPTRLSAYSYGKGDQVSLYQTLNIKQPPSKTFISGEDNEVDWAEFKLDETNYLTIDKQQVGYFPKNGAYAVSHRTAEMLDKIIRAGVLGDDGDDLDELPEGVQLPSRRPALVCESCLYSKDEMNRLRAFHVLDPRGLLDFIGVFEEKKDDVESISCDEDIIQDECRLDALLGTWSGHSLTRRSGVYGSTLVEEDTLVTFTLEDNGNLIQNIKTPKGRFQLVGTSYGNIVKFDKGLQMTLLPRGLAMASPVNVGQTVNRAQAFYFEFSWVYSPGKRRRLVRTYDTDGIVVSSTFVDEVKL